MRVHIEAIDCNSSISSLIGVLHRRLANDRCKRCKTHPASGQPHQSKCFNRCDIFVPQLSISYPRLPKHGISDLRADTMAAEPSAKQHPDLTASEVTIQSDSENYGNNDLSPSPPSSNSPVILYKPPTVWSLFRGAVINLFLPFVNGLMLGFGELLAHEAAFRFGWAQTKVRINCTQAYLTMARSRLRSLRYSCRY